MNFETIMTYLSDHKTTEELFGLAEDFSTITSGHLDNYLKY